MSVRTRGTFQIRRLRARLRVTSDKATYTVPYVGPYESLQANIPGIDSSLPGIPAAYKVTEVTLEEGRSVEGKMTVIAELALPGNTGSTDDAQLGETVYELDWSEERRPIEEHQNCPKLKDDRLVYEKPDLAYDATTNSGWSSSGAAPAGKSGRQRTWDDWSSMDAGDVTGGTWSIDQYKAIKQRGVNDFSIPFPIARTTIYAKYRITPIGAVNTISSPPGSCGAPSGWTFVKTASRSQKQGRQYTLIEEWRGFPGSNWSIVFG